MADRNDADDTAPTIPLAAETHLMDIGENGFPACWDTGHNAEPTFTVWAGTHIMLTRELAAVSCPLCLRKVN